MRSSSFTHNFLLLFAGPIIWALHFVAIYGFTGVICARPLAKLEWLGVNLTTWGIGGAGFVAILAIAAVYVAARPRDTVPDNRHFVQWMSVTLSLLSVIAIIWETMTVFIVPHCA